MAWNSREMENIWRQWCVSNRYLYTRFFSVLLLNFWKRSIFFLFEFYVLFPLSDLVFKPFTIFILSSILFDFFFCGWKLEKFKLAMLQRYIYSTCVQFVYIWNWLQTNRAHIKWLHTELERQQSKPASKRERELYLRFTLNIEN